MITHSQAGMQAQQAVTDLSQSIIQRHQEIYHSPLAEEQQQVEIIAWHLAFQV
jgi:hypothetical protein